MVKLLTRRFFSCRKQAQTKGKTKEGACALLSKQQDKVASPPCCLFSSHRRDHARKQEKVDCFCKDKLSRAAMIILSATSMPRAERKLWMEWMVEQIEKKHDYIEKIYVNGWIAVQSVNDLDTPKDVANDKKMLGTTSLSDMPDLQSKLVVTVVP